MQQGIALGVNVDHVATVRQARGGDNPDPVRAAILAQQAGADGITAHLREDRRHISDDDILRLTQALTIPLNLEMAATDEMAARKPALRVWKYPAASSRIAAAQKRLMWNERWSSAGSRSALACSVSIPMQKTTPSRTLSPQSARHRCQNSG